MSIRKYQPEQIGRTPSTAIAILVGHLPRYVYVDGGNFNAVLVREGSLRALRKGLAFIPDPLRVRCSCRFLSGNPSSAGLGAQE